jgi:glutaredoxin
MKILIIGQEDSSICETAKDFSNNNKIRFEYKRVPEDISLETAYNLAGGMFNDFPAIIINDNYIGSLKEYEELYYKSKNK